MKKEDILIQQLNSIAQKLSLVEKMNYKEYDLDFTKEEEEILSILKPISLYLMHEEISLLNHKIKNHHHLVLSVENGIKYRDNGMNIIPTSINETLSEEK